MGQEPWHFMFSISPSGQWRYTTRSQSHYLTTTHTQSYPSSPLRNEVDFECGGGGGGGHPLLTRFICSTQISTDPRISITWCISYAQDQSCKFRLVKLGTLKVLLQSIGDNYSYCSCISPLIWPHSLRQNISNCRRLCGLKGSKLVSVLAIAIPLWLPLPLSEWIRRAREPYLFLPPGIPEIFCLFAECGRTHLPEDFFKQGIWGQWLSDIVTPLGNSWYDKQDIRYKNSFKQNMSRRVAIYIPTYLHGWKNL